MVQASAGHAAQFVQRIQELRRTQIEREVKQAMGKWDFDANNIQKAYHFIHFSYSALSSEKILAVFRERAAQCSKKDVEASERLRKIKDELTMNLSTDNHTTLV